MTAAVRRTPEAELPTLFAPVRPHDPAGRWCLGLANLAILLDRRWPGPTGAANGTTVFLRRRKGAFDQGVWAAVAAYNGP